MEVKTESLKAKPWDLEDLLLLVMFCLSCKTYTFEVGKLYVESKMGT